MGAGVRDAFPPPMCVLCVFGMETPLHERSGGHIGTAPTVSFGQIVCGRLISFGWIARGWLVLLGWIVRKCITVSGRGGACVPARVALQGRIRRSFPAHHACIFGMETLLRGRSGGHAGTAPTVSFGQIARGRLVSFGWIACKWLFCLCRIVRKNMMEIGRGGACVPARVAPQGRIHR